MRVEDVEEKLNETDTEDAIFSTHTHTLPSPPCCTCLHSCLFTLGLSRSFGQMFSAVSGQARARRFVVGWISRRTRVSAENARVGCRLVSCKPAKRKAACCLSTYRTAVCFSRAVTARFAHFRKLVVWGLLSQHVLTDGRAH